MGYMCGVCAGYARMRRWAGGGGGGLAGYVRDVSIAGWRVWVQNVAEDHVVQRGSSRIECIVWRV